MFDQEESSVEFISFFTLYWNSSSAEVRALEFKDGVFKGGNLGVVSWSWGNYELVRAESESGFSFSFNFGSSGLEVCLAGLNSIDSWAWVWFLSWLLTSGVSIVEVSLLIDWWHSIIFIFIKRYFQLYKLILGIFFRILFTFFTEISYLTFLLIFWLKKSLFLYFFIDWQYAWQIIRETLWKSKENRVGYIRDCYQSFW